jgi:hydroxymethylpyrimidine/phosphomethylpyrimidine kinase
MEKKAKLTPVLLVISGFDPSNQAGYGSDIRTATCLGVHPIGVITALTSQIPGCFKNNFPVQASRLEEQLSLLLSYYSISAIKIGMVYSAAVCEVVYRFIKEIRIPVITDPVLSASAGGSLLNPKAWNAYGKVLRSSSLLTPNLPEAMQLADTDNANPRELGANLHDRYGTAVLVKGGHSKKKTLEDWYYDGKNYYSWKRKKITTINTHGTGCMLSSAIASYCAKGFIFTEAIHRAEAFLTLSFNNPLRIQSRLYLQHVTGNN